MGMPGDCDNSRNGLYSLIGRFMGPTWGPSGADRTQMGPMLASWTLLSSNSIWALCFRKMRYLSHFFKTLIPDAHDTTTYYRRIWWRHKMKTFSRYWPFVRWFHRSPVGSPHKGQWRGTLVFSLICSWTNGSVNNLDAGDLRRHRAHYDVTVIWCSWYNNILPPKHIYCSHGVLEY